MNAQPEPWDTPDMAYRPNGLSVEQEPLCWLKETGSIGGGYEQTTWGDTSGFPVFTAPVSKQAPVAWISDSPTKGNGKQLHFTKANAWKWSSNITPLYTAPVSKPWVSLTDKQIFSTYEKCTWSNGYVSWTEFARTIEAASKELNT